MKKVAVEMSKYYVLEFKFLSNMKSVLLLFVLHTIILPLNALAIEKYDLEKWSTIILVRTTGDNTKFYYLKKHNMADKDEKVFLESLRNSVKSKTPTSRIFAIKYHEGKAPDSILMTVTEDEANTLEKLVSKLSIEFQGFPDK